MKQKKLLAAPRKQIIWANWFSASDGQNKERGAGNAPGFDTCTNAWQFPGEVKKTPKRGVVFFRLRGQETKLNGGNKGPREI